MAARGVLLLMLMMCLLVACGGDGVTQADDPTATVRPMSSPTPLVSSQATIVPANTETAESITLTIWWPDEFYPVEIDVLEDQLQVFAASQEEDLNIELRRKPMHDTGGILSTLQSATVAAPGALPDLTLLRYSDFVSALQLDLLSPMDGVIRIGLADGIYSSAIALSERDGEVYGLPYAIDLSVLAHDEGLGLDAAAISLDDMLEIDRQWAFPVGRLSGVSTSIYLQYLMAGGSLVDENGVFTVNPDALATVYNFYEAALATETLDADVTNYTALSDYSLALITGDLSAGVMTFSEYLSIRSDADELRIGMIPTQSDEAITVLDSWMWVMPSDDPGNQEFVAAFLEWMMAPTRQSALTSATRTLPSQRNVLNGLETADFDVELVDRLVSNALLPLVDVGNITALRTIQNGVIAIINGELSAEQATENVMRQLSSSN